MQRNNPFVVFARPCVRIVLRLEISCSSLKSDIPSPRIVGGRVSFPAYIFAGEDFLSDKIKYFEPILLGDTRFWNPVTE